MPPRGPRFSITPEQLSVDTRLVGCDWRVLHRLGRHTDRDGWCMRSQRKLADELGLDRVTVLRSLKRLAALGYVDTRRALREDGGNASLHYRVVIPSDQAELFAGDATPPVASMPPAPVASAPPPPESSRTTPPRSRLRATGIRTTPEERTAEDARAAASLRRRTQRPADQRALLLPIHGGCRSAAKAPPDAVPVGKAEGAVPPRKVELDRLEAALRAAAGGSLHVVSTALMVLSDPLRWLDQGCDLERDVLPALRAVAERSRPGAVRTWGYFTEAVFEARDRRLAPSPPPREPPTDEGRHGSAESPTRAALRRIRGGR